MRFVNQFKQVIEQKTSEVIFSEVRGFRVNFKALSFFIRRNEKGQVEGFKVVENDQVVFFEDVGTLENHEGIGVELSNLYNH